MRRTRHTLADPLISAVVVGSMGLVALLAATSVCSAQPKPPAGKLSISQVGGKPAGPRVPLSSSVVSAVQGTFIASDTRDLGRHVVQLLVCRVYNQECRVVGTSEPVPTAAKGKGREWTWSIEQFRLPVPEFGKGYEIKGALVESYGSFEGLIDIETLRRRASVLSEGVALFFDQKLEVLNLEGDCAVNIESVESLGSSGSKTPKTEVGAAADVRGRAVKSGRGYVHVVADSAVGDGVVVLAVVPMTGTRWAKDVLFRRIATFGGALRIRAVLS